MIFFKAHYTLTLGKSLSFLTVSFGVLVSQNYKKEILLYNTFFADSSITNTYKLIIFLKCTRTLWTPCICPRKEKTDCLHKLI